MKQILIHGLGQAASSWEEVISRLNLADHAICPDLAELVNGKEVTYGSLYSSFSTMCDGMDEPLHLCGLSLGGVLALHYAIDHPGKVKSLVLIATQYVMPKRLLKFQNAVFRCMPNSMVQKTGFKREDFLNLSRTMMSLNFSDSVHKITCSTLILYGAKDKANKSASIKLANEITNAELRVLAGVGHEVNTEAPEQLSEILRLFYCKNW